MKRTFKGYAVRDGAGWWMNKGPGLIRTWSESPENREVFAQMSHAIGAITAEGERRGILTPIYATRKPKPAPAEGAAEGRYAVAYQTATMPHAKMDPHVFLSRAQVDEWLAWNKHRADGVVRILPDGALEAACEAAYERGKTDALRNVHALGTVEAARREERERVCADTKKAIEKYVWDHSSVDVTHIYKLLDEAAKGQAK